MDKVEDLEKEIRRVLEEFVLNFAQKQSNGCWWGQDTDLGDCKEHFEKAINNIMGLHYHCNALQALEEINNIEREKNHD